MTWYYLIPFLLLLLILTRVVVRRPGQRISMYEFEHWVHSFAKIKKEGGTMTFSHSGSPLFLRFRRGIGTERRCELLADVPRAGWSEPKLDALRSRLEQKGAEATAPPNEMGVLLRVELEIPDIWDRASGAKGARLAQEIFEVLGLGPEARFNVAMKGENSVRTWGPTAERWSQERNPLLRRIGRKLGDELEHEIESERSEPNE